MKKLYKKKKLGKKSVDEIGKIVGAKLENENINKKVVEKLILKEKKTGQNLLE